MQIPLATSEAFMKELKTKVSKNSCKNSSRELERINSERNMTGVGIEMIGTYRIQSLLGKGGYAIVRKAKSWKGGLFAIKTYEKLQ